MILSQLKILDKNNQVYTENYTYTILKEESKKDWGTFVVAAPDINIRSKISPENLMNTIKKQCALAIFWVMHLILKFICGSGTLQKKTY